MTLENFDSEKYREQLKQDLNLETLPSGNTPAANNTFKKTLDAFKSEQGSFRYQKSKELHGATIANEDSEKNHSQVEKSETQESIEGIVEKQVNDPLRTRSLEFFNDPELKKRALNYGMSAYQKNKPGGFNDVAVPDSLVWLAEMYQFNPELFKQKAPEKPIGSLIPNLKKQMVLSLTENLYPSNSKIFDLIRAAKIAGISQEELETILTPDVKKELREKLVSFIQEMAASPNNLNISQIISPLISMCRADKELFAEVIAEVLEADYGNRVLEKLSQFQGDKKTLEFRQTLAYFGLPLEELSPQDIDFLSNGIRMSAMTTSGLNRFSVGTPQAVRGFFNHSSKIEDLR